MDKLEFMRWCAAATADIKYKPDRERVSEELYAHLEDRCAAMTEAGVPEAEAVKQALAAMGSADEVAEQMAKIHRPFWGYLLPFHAGCCSLPRCLCSLPCRAGSFSNRSAADRKNMRRYILIHPSG